MHECQSEKEIELLKFLVEKTKDVDGDLIEVGTYWGYSAKAISEVKNKKLYLFDTFDGFHDLEAREESFRDQFRFGNCLEFVRNLNLPDTEVIQGYFPDCAKFDDKKFSFAHIDVDSYTSTLKCLEYLYPKMSDGGIIVIHDYIQPSLLVKDAVDKFVDGKKFVFSVGTSQAILWK